MVQPVRINQVGDYCKGEEINITLTMEYKQVKSLSILENGAGVAIATKSIWETWGKPAIKKLG